MIVDPRRIELTPQQQEEIAAIAMRFGKPWPDVLHEALTTYRAQADVNARTDESFLTAASRLGLLGRLSGGPSDLSSNPDHMQGFGGND
jgi:hypothetical protein